MTFGDKLAAIRDAVETVRASVGTDDPDYAEVLANALEGETDFEGICGWIIRGVNEAKTYASACTDEAQRYKLLAERHTHRQDRLRELLMLVLHAADQRKVRTAFGSASIVPVHPKVIVADDAVEYLPERFVRIEKKPDRKAIKAALDAGEIVQGASMSNGGETVRIG